jgi:hypothetical protein
MGLCHLSAWLIFFHFSFWRDEFTIGRNPLITFGYCINIPFERNLNI